MNFFRAEAFVIFETLSRSNSTLVPSRSHPEVQGKTASAAPRMRTPPRVRHTATFMTRSPSESNMTPVG